MEQFKTLFKKKIGHSWGQLVSAWRIITQIHREEWYHGLRQQHEHEQGTHRWRDTLEAKEVNDAYHLKLVVDSLVKVGQQF